MPKAKILLIDPFYNPSTVPPNWSLGIIESHLSNLGIETSIADFVNSACEGESMSFFLKQEDVFIDDILNKANSCQYVYITTSFGIPLKQKPVFPRVIKICKQLKHKFPNINIAVGGSNINYANRMLGIDSFENIDFGLIDKYILGDENNFIEYLCNVSDVPKESLNIDASLRWSGWDHDKYPKYLSLLAAKGCVFNCSFCFESKIFEQIYKTVPVKLVIDDIIYATSHHGIHKYAIEDSTFLSNPQLEEFCDEIISRKIDITWSAYARINQIISRKHLLQKMRQAGCTSLIVGIESSNNKTLKEVKKNITSSDTVEAVRLLSGASIKMQGCFVLGFPGETYQDIKDTIDFGLSLNLLSYRWHIYQPNLSDSSQKYLGDILPRPDDYLKIQVNIPDSCIPEALETSTSPISLLTEEHFLIKSIPYLDPNNKILNKYGYNGFMFGEMLKIIKSKLLQNSRTFDEESMYNLI